MTPPARKLAASLDALKALQERGVVAIHARDIGRIHRERLQKNGFLQEVMKGWYIPSRPDGTASERTAWYASFWLFSRAYLHERFGGNASEVRAFPAPVASTLRRPQPRPMA
jgi:hypothetical protein